jgi:hypothetical protein
MTYNGLFNLTIELGASLCKIVDILQKLKKPLANFITWRVLLQES